MDVIAIAKEHPVPVGIGVLVIVLLLMRSGSSQPSSASVSNAAAYQAQSQLTSINAGTSVALGAQSVDRAKIAEDAATTRAGVMAGLFSTLAGLSAQTTLKGQDNTLKIVQSSFSSADNQKQLDNQLALGTATVNANVRMNSDKLAAEHSNLIDDNNFKLSQIGLQTQGSIAMIGAGKDAQLALAAQNNAFTASTMPSIFAQQALLAGMGYKSASDLATITGQNATNIAQIQVGPSQTAAQAGKNKSDWGIVTDIGKIIGSFFAM